MGIGLAALAAVTVGACSGSSGPGAQSSPNTTPAALPTTAARSSPVEADRVTWPAPPDAMQLARRSGLVPERAEFLAFHVHSHLDVFVNGTPVVVPAGIGINIHDPAVVAFPNPDGSTGYGGIQPPCKQACISPLHTHDVDGVLHTESKTPAPNRLGQFFTEWGVRLTPSCVDSFCAPKTPIAFYVNGQRYELDPRTIELTDLSEIAVVIGIPPATIPSVFPG
jgi:hypothetical protein